MTPVDIQERVQIDVLSRVNYQQPEGVSVCVAATPAQREALGGDLTEVALLIAEREYPNVNLTGAILYVGLDDLGEDVHEVVCEVGVDHGQIVYSKTQNNR